MSAAPGRAARAAEGLIRAYQGAVSPLLPEACRYWPSCSEYARQSILRRGVLAGGVAALLRVLRCQPLCSGGIDPPR